MIVQKEEDVQNEFIWSFPSFIQKAVLTTKSTKKDQVNQLISLSS